MSARTWLGRQSAGFLGLVASAGLWILKKWDQWLAIILNVLGDLSAAPGVGAGPNAALQAAAIAGVLIDALLIVLVVLPSSQRALAASWRFRED